MMCGRRSALTRSLRRIGHPQWSWIALGIALEPLRARLLGDEIRTKVGRFTLPWLNRRAISAPGAGRAIRHYIDGADPPTTGMARYGEPATGSNL